MIRTCLLALLAFAVLLVFLPSDPVYAHGSSYRGPSGDVPPGQREPMPPPPDGGRPWARSSWVAWWSYNKEAFLFPEAMAGLTAPLVLVDEPALDEVFAALTRALEHKMSCPERSRIALATGCLAAGAGRLPTAPRDRLIELMRDREQQTIVQTSCAFALGLSRSRDPAVLTAVMDTMLNDEAPEAVRGGAALAMGFLRPPADAPEHRRWIVTLERAPRYESMDQLADCAHLAMGLSNEPGFLPALLKVLSSTDVSRVAPAVIAIGKMAESLPEAPADAVVPHLGRMLGTSDPELRRVLITAIGQWAGRPGMPSDTALAITDRLLGATGDKDLTVVDQVWIALARIGAAAEDRALRDRIRTALVAASEAKDLKNAAMSAIALGILGRSGHLADEECAAIAAALRTGLAAPPEAATDSPIICADGPAPAPGAVTPTTPTTPPPPPGIGAEPSPRTIPPPPMPKPDPVRDPTVRTAFAIGLALCGDRESLTGIRELGVDKATMPRDRGLGSVARAMLGDESLRAEIAASLPSCSSGDLLVLGSIAAGLLGDRDLRGLLEPLLDGRRPSSLSRSFLFRALGKLGDRRAIPALLRTLDDGKAGGGLRSAAAVAIADLYDREGALIMTRLTRDLSRRSALGALRLIFKAM